FQAEDGIRDFHVTGVQTCALPILAAYAATLPPDLLHFLPGAGSGLSFSDICRLVGLNDAARLQHQLLRQFVSSHGVKTDQGRRFVATLETLLALTRACAQATAHLACEGKDRKSVV